MRHLALLFLSTPTVAGAYTVRGRGERREVGTTKIVEYTFEAQDWVVNYLRPTVDLGGRAKRKNPWEMPADVRKAAQLVNGVYPGPLIEAYENETIVVHVVNNLLGEGLSIHWHGIHQIGTPFADGSVGIAQAPIQPGENYTYRFKAWPPGTHWWHSHMDALQADKGIKGPIVVHRATDPFAHMYTEEKIVAIADEWREPEICLKVEGALPGNPGALAFPRAIAWPLACACPTRAPASPPSLAVHQPGPTDPHFSFRNLYSSPTTLASFPNYHCSVCAEIEHASFNGQYGDGTAEYPFPTIDVEQGEKSDFSS